MSGQAKAVLIAGAAGYVGSQIVEAIKENPSYQLLTLLRGQCEQEAFSRADIIIHTANPARRFQAEQDPQRDFVETVEKTHRFLRLAKEKRFVLVSSLSCRTQLNTTYGRHRRACEAMAALVGAAVVRLGPMFGGGRRQDVLHDILLGREVYISAETQYAYVDVRYAARRIVQQLESSTGISEIGARNSVKLKDIAFRFNSATQFSGPDDTQIPENCEDGPDARNVFEFAEAEHSETGKIENLQGF